MRSFRSIEVANECNSPNTEESGEKKTQTPQQLEKHRLFQQWIISKHWCCWMFSTLKVISVQTRERERENSVVKVAYGTVSCCRVVNCSSTKVPPKRKSDKKKRKKNNLNIIPCEHINHTRTRCAVFLYFIYYLGKTRYFSILYCLINYYQGGGMVYAASARDILPHKCWISYNSLVHTVAE